MNRGSSSVKYKQTPILIKVDNSTEVIEFLKLCRVCMNQSTVMHEIFQDGKDFSIDNTISNKIAFCTSVEIAENDGLPQQICDTCFSTLLSSYELKTVCIQSDNQYKKILQDVESVENDSTNNQDQFDAVKNETKGSNSNELLYLKKDTEDEQKEEYLEDYIVETSVVDDFNDYYVDDIKDISIDAAPEPIDNVQDTLSNCKELVVKKLPANARKRKLVMKSPKKNCVFTCMYCKIKFATKDQVLKHEKTHKSSAFQLGMKTTPRPIIVKKIKLDDSIADFESLEREIKQQGCKLIKISNPMVKESTVSVPKERKKPGRKMGKKKKEPGDGPTRMICEFCGKSYIRGSSHSQHLKTHMQPMFKCDICGHSTWSRSDLQRHIVTHTTVRSHPCLLCPKTFKTIACLRMHERRVHIAKSRDYDCEYCHKKYYFKENLKLHIATKHEIDERHTCVVCNEGFKERQTWRKHMLNKHQIVVPHIKPIWRKKNLIFDS